MNANANKNKNKNKNVNTASNMDPENVKNLYEVNTTNFHKSLKPGNMDENTENGMINWPKFLPAVNGQRAATNPSPPVRKPFGSLPTFMKGGTRYRRRMRTRKTRRNRKQK